MHDNYRENYLKARKIVAHDLKEKYNLIESFIDDNRLTLDSANFSIHLTFYLPDGDNISVSEKGKEPGYGYSYMSLITLKFPDRNDMILYLKKTFSDIEQYDYTISTIVKKLKRKINLIETQFPEYLKSINT